MVLNYRGWGSGFIFQYNIVLKYIITVETGVCLHMDQFRLFVITYDHNILSVICNALMSRDTHLMFTTFHYDHVQSLIPIVSTICFYLLEGHAVKVFLINNHVLNLPIRNCTHVYYWVVSRPSMSVIYIAIDATTTIISDKIA